MSAVKINISGANITGNAKVLNNMKVDEQSEVNVNIKNSILQEQAQVFNDMDAQGKNVNATLENVNIGKDVKFMNNKESDKQQEDKTKGEVHSEPKQEEVRTEQVQAKPKVEQDSKSNLHKEKNEPQNSNKKESIDIPTDLLSTVQLVPVEAKKENFIKRLFKKIVEKFSKPQETYKTVQLNIVPTGAEHKAFEDKISENGKLKNIQVNLKDINLDNTQDLEKLAQQRKGENENSL